MQGTIGPRYATLQDLRSYMSSQGSLPATQDGLLTDCLLRAERAIDAYTRRNFAGTPGTVYYNRFQQRQVVGQALYLNEDLHTLVSVNNGDTTSLPIGSVWLEPRNAGPPYRVLRLHSQYVWVWNTDSDVIVAGTFGYGTIPPDDIVQATVRQASYFYRIKDTGFGQQDVTGFQEAGEVPVTQGLVQDVRFLLAPYRSKSGGVV